MEKMNPQKQNIEALRNKWQNQKQQNHPHHRNNNTPYGVTNEGESALKLCLIERTGKRTYMPYSFQPVFVYDPETNLTIKTTSFSIIITGRGLDTLCDHLANDSLLWINESKERIDDGETPLFIEKIEFEGLLSEG